MQQAGTATQMLDGAPVSSLRHSKYCWNIVGVSPGIWPRRRAEGTLRPS